MPAFLRPLLVPGNFNQLRSDTITFQLKVLELDMILLAKTYVQFTTEQRFAKRR